MEQRIMRDSSQKEVCVYMCKTPAASDNTHQAKRISWEATDFILASRTRECEFFNLSVRVCCVYSMSVGEGTSTNSLHLFKNCA